MLNNRYEPWNIGDKHTPLSYEDDVSDEPVEEEEESFDGMGDYDLPLGTPGWPDDNDDFDDVGSEDF